MSDAPPMMPDCQLDVTGAALIGCAAWLGAPFAIVRKNLLYETERGVQFGDYSFGPHQCWSIGVKTEDRDGFVTAFRAWVHSIGGGVSSYGYDPKAPIVYFGVTLPKAPNDEMRDGERKASANTTTNL